MYRTALVTGASRGIGRALCIWLARREVRVWACARNADALASLAAAHPALIEPLVLDVAGAAADVAAAVRNVDDAAGGLDLVVANAAVGPPTPVSAEHASLAESAHIVDVNCRGAVATLLAIAARMASRGDGHLVGMSSLGGARGLPEYAAYSASKAFLTTFLEGLRMELAPRGVVVTTVRPGFVKTEGTVDNAFPMPFLVELDDAVERIGTALLAGDTDVAFPWQAAAAAAVSRTLPDAVWERALRRFRRLPSPQ